MSQVRWIVAGYEESKAEALAKELDLSQMVAQLLVARGVNSAEEAHQFLHPSLDDLHDPFLLPDADLAVKRILRAVESHERVMVHGDYDVDGVASAALLVRSLKALGVDVIHRLPHRQTEGYDIKPAAVDEAKAAGATLIVTSDCGVTALATAARAKELGVDLVVTDHHEPGPELPQALAVVNPKRTDSRYPFPELAGVGVAFKVMDAVVRELGHKQDLFRSRFLDLVAMGTVSDVAPLVGENRVLVKYGMQAIPGSKKAGLQALLRRCRLQGKDLLAYHLSHVIGPRINAVGRMDTAEIALNLLLTRDDDEAERLAAVLDQANAERQAEQSRIFEEALQRVAEVNLEDKKVLVLSAPGWNTGVVGIVASKIVEQFGRPAILLSEDGEAGVCSGSARSIDQFNLIDALRSCEDLLIRCGGHQHAAGLCVETAKLEGFEEKLNRIAGEIIRPEDLIPTIVVDGVLHPEEVGFDLAREIAALEPFGHGNPEPVFVTPELEVVNKQRVGGDGSHLKMRVRGHGTEPADCIGFGMGELADGISVGSEVDICYNIRVNRFNGYENVQLVAKDLRGAGEAELVKLEAVE